MSAISEQVLHALKGWEEAFNEAKDEGLNASEAERAATLAWGAMLPVVDSMQAARTYIAHIAAGQARGWLSGEQARGMMYTAQCAISALRAKG